MKLASVDYKIHLQQTYIKLYVKHEYKTNVFQVTRMSHTKLSKTIKV